MRDTAAAGKLDGRRHVAKVIQTTAPLNCALEFAVVAVGRNEFYIHRVARES